MNNFMEYKTEQKEKNMEAQSEDVLNLKPHHKQS